MTAAGLLDAKLSATTSPTILELISAAVRTGRAFDGRDHALSPGSPVLARGFCGRGDILAANEALPEDRALLKAEFARDDASRRSSRSMRGRSSAAAAEGAAGRGADRSSVRRKPGEFQRITEGTSGGSTPLRHWHHDRLVSDQEHARRSHAFIAMRLALGFVKLFVAELVLGPVRSEGDLMGTGLLIVNPPFTLAEKLERLLPFLGANTCARREARASRAEWLAGEHVTSS